MKLLTAALLTGLVSVVAYAVGTHYDPVQCREVAVQDVGECTPGRPELGGEFPGRCRVTLVDGLKTTATRPVQPGDKVRLCGDSRPYIPRECRSIAVESVGFCTSPTIDGFGGHPGMCRVVLADGTKTKAIRPVGVGDSVQVCQQL